MINIDFAGAFLAIILFIAVLTGFIMTILGILLHYLYPNNTKNNIVNLTKENENLKDINNKLKIQLENEQKNK